jgi:hypothetical protein
VSEVLIVEALVEQLERQFGTAKTELAQHLGSHD